MRSLISIIIPVYNVEKYIKDCISSVIEQTYRNLEIILVDDGSCDQSGKICDDFANQDKRILVIHQNNEGVSSARNIGLASSSGEYIMFVDSDDWLEKDCCEKCLSQIIKKEADICIFEMFINRDKSEERTNVLVGAEYWEKDEILCRMIPFKNNDNEKTIVFHGPYCKLFKREKCINQEFNKDLKYGEDAIFNLKVVAQSEKICFLDKGLYHYRKNDNSVTAVFRTDRSKQTILRLKLTEKVLINANLYCNEKIIRAFNEMYVNICLWIINNMFVGKRISLKYAWLDLKEFVKDKWMIEKWKDIKKSGIKIKILDVLFSNNSLKIMFVFLRLRYL